METILDICAAILLLTGGFLVATLWIAIIVAIVIEVSDRAKERNSVEEE